MTKNFLVQADGAVTVSKEEPETLVPASRYPEILAKLEDHNSSPEEVLRLIYSEIVTLIMKIKQCGSDAVQVKKVERYRKQIQSLFAAAENYKKSKPAEKGDRLDLDGPAYKWLFNAIVQTMEKATREALGKNNGEMCQKIMNNFHDIMKKEDPRLRRGVQEIGSTTGTKASDVSESGKG
ncbi:MAG: hypothetical protein WCA19_25415 [Candidatus Acidiferrales bacterium]